MTSTARRGAALHALGLSELEAEITALRMASDQRDERMEQMRSECPFCHGVGWVDFGVDDAGVAWVATCVECDGDGYVINPSVVWESDQCAERDDLPVDWDALEDYRG